MAGPLFVDIPNQNTRAIVIRNLFNQTHITGMRITDDGFFHITNKISGGTEARLDSGGSWSKASDRRLKRDVQPATHLFEKLLALQPVEFYYTTQDVETMPHKSVGFIAQDVEPVFPHLVVGTETKYLDYTGLVPIAIGAMQEMKQYYDDKLATLERQLVALQQAVQHP
jgi:hypothetical protein